MDRKRGHSTFPGKVECPLFLYLSSVSVIARSTPFTEAVMQAKP